MKRNKERFPNDFMFQITTEEKLRLVTICDHLQSLQFSYQNPYAFTEHGVTAVAGILRSETAVQINIKIIRAFVTMRKFIFANKNIFSRLENVELKQLEHDKQLQLVFDAMKTKQLLLFKGIFFQGQMFDAHMFVSDIIKTAKKSIILVDNYVDETTLSLLAKKKKSVLVHLYVKSPSSSLRVDVKKFNEQYGGLYINSFTKSHDRFLCVDNKELFHFGASLKDLGKKWFAFSKFNSFIKVFLQELQN